MKKVPTPERLWTNKCLTCVAMVVCLAGCCSTPVARDDGPSLSCVAQREPSGSSSAPRDNRQYTEGDPARATCEPQIERGRRAPVADTLGWIVGIPAKIIMLDHRVDNHQVSPETEQSIRQFLARNDLENVKVRVNQYDPLGEWRRLRDNNSVSWPIRYTIGTVSVVGYTLFPGRIWGGDHYNPYTNSVYLYSDVPAMAVYEGAFAKDFAVQEHRDLYAVGYALPGVNLWHGAAAASDAIDYLGACGSEKELKDGYQSICPAYARSVAPLATVTNVPLTLPAIVVGHAVGQAKSAGVPETQRPSADTPKPVE